VRTADGALAARVTRNGNYAATPAKGAERTVTVGDLPAALSIPGGIQVIDDRKSRVRGRLETTFAVPADQPGGDLEWWLDLGRVHCHAVVTLNGKRLRTLWKAPYRIRVDHLLRDANDLRIEVVSPWAKQGDRGFNLPAATELLGGPLRLRPVRLVATERS
jgi:hypothetical protein